MIKRIFIAGFRATGKSTVARILAGKTGWDLIDIDEEIVKRTNHSINQITQSGKEWSEFRRLESEVLNELLQKEKIVVSTGGGAFVNETPSPSGIGYGKLNKETVSGDPESIIVLLTAPWETIKERIERHEKRRRETARPILNEQTAKVAEQYKHDKQQIIKTILEDSKQSFEARKDAYSKLTNLKFDCHTSSSEEIAIQIMKYLDNL